MTVVVTSPPKPRAAPEPSVEPSHETSGWRRPVALMLLATAAVWLPLYLQRWAAHEPNVDDYLYTIVSRQIADAGSVSGFVHAVLHTGQTAPLVPLIAAPAALAGVDGAVAVELPLLLLLAAAAWLLARRWVGPWAAALIGLAAATNQAVLGWALMMHFSVAAGAFCLLALAAYLWSDGFRHWGWSALTGVAIGMLLLSRSLAPVYVAAFVLVIAADLVLRRLLRIPQAALAALLAAAVAGPWWLVSGGTALHYLRSAGYQSSSGFTSTGAHLSISSIADRTAWTLGDLGTLQSIVLLAVPLVAVLRGRRPAGALIVTGWLALTLIGLSTSSNIGTGFGLPLVAVGITLTASLLLTDRVATTAPSPESPGGRRMWSALARWAPVLIAILTAALLVHAIAANGGPGLGWPLVASTVVLGGTLLALRPVAAVAIAIVIAVGVGAELTGGVDQSWLGPPYRRMALEATSGGPVPNVDAVHQSVARAIAGRSTLLARDDDLLNGNGLRYTAMNDDLSQALVSAPYGDLSGAVRELKGTKLQFLIAGASPASYHHYPPGAVEAAAARDGWKQVREWNLACGNTITLWQRSSAPAALSKQRLRFKRPTYEALVLSDHPAALWRQADEMCGAANRTQRAAASAATSQFRAQSLSSGRPTSGRFNGKDDIAFDASPITGRTRAISLEGWVRADALPTATGSGWQLISLWNQALLYIRGGEKPTFVFAVYDPTKGSYLPAVGSTTTVAARRVYHVVGTYDGSRLRIYVDGALQASVPYAGTLGQSRYGGAIAAAGWGKLRTRHFRGEIEEVAVYAHALAAKRVLAHYRLGWFGPRP